MLGEREGNVKVVTGVGVEGQVNGRGLQLLYRLDQFATARPRQTDRQHPAEGGGDVRLEGALGHPDGGRTTLKSEETERRDSDRTWGHCRPTLSVLGRERS